MRLLRRDGLPEAVILVAVAALVAVVFAVTPLDIAVARVFFRPDAADHWAFGKQWPWSSLYRLGPVITLGLFVLGLLALMIGRVRRDEFSRVNGVFLLLGVLIGPGLMINAALKDHWDRPRPRDLVEFGGTLQYTPAPLPAAAGEPFPSSDCLAGFLYASGWWMWRRRRPVWAGSSLALGLGLGFTLGLDRMAAGDYFLSEVIWSALLALGLAHVLYYHVLRLPAHEGASATLDEPAARLPGMRTMAVLLILAAAVGSPHGQRFSTHVDPSLMPRPAQVLAVTAPAANIRVIDATRDRTVNSGRLQLDRRTADGPVQQPDR
jgi:lipid A 4'-phosphatase